MSSFHRDLREMAVIESHSLRQYRRIGESVFDRLREIQRRSQLTDNEDALSRKRLWMSVSVSAPRANLELRLSRRRKRVRVPSLPPFTIAKTLSDGLRRLPI